MRLGVFFTAAALRRSTIIRGLSRTAIVERTAQTPLVVLAVALCILMSSETWVGAGLPRSEHEQVDVAKLRTVDGTVTKVDPAAGAIRVAWGPLGVFAKTLEVQVLEPVWVQAGETLEAAGHKVHDAPDGPRRCRGGPSVGCGR